MKLTTKLMLKKYQTSIITVAIVLAVLVGFAWSSRPTATQTPQADVPKDAEVMQSFDFGTISMAKGKVSRIVPIVNSTAEPLTLTKLYASCMCTTGTLVIGDKKFGPFGMPMHGPIPTLHETLLPGDRAEVEVIFDPAAHGPAGVGRVSRVVYLETSAGKKEIRFSANVIP